MLRSLMTIKELYLYLTEIIFMLNQSVKLRRYINHVMWQRVCNGNVRFKLMQSVDNINIEYRLQK